MRKTFQLGGYPFTAPEVIGVGIRARASQITTDISEERKIPNDPQQIIQRYFYDYSLKLLELILTPSENSPSVKDAYDIATDEEVQAIMGFFGQSANGKTTSAKSKAKGLQNSKRTAEANI
jgi:hypothetical protein